MAASLRPSLLPICSSCTRRFADLAIDGWRPFQQHVRGKKKLANHSDTLIVRLLKDVKGYGKKGTYVPVPRGMGRNQWIPQRTAEYVPQAQIRTLRLSNTPIERDPAFGLDLPDVPVENKDIRSIQSTMKPTVRIEQLTPERKAELITIFLPATLVFNRPVVENSTNQAIYGSVSIQDIAAHVRQSLAHNPEASRVLVTDFEARFVLPEGKKSPDARKTPDGEELEDDKVKHLGEYEVEIQVHGSGDIIKRKVRVLPNTPDKSE